MFLIATCLQSVHTVSFWLQCSRSQEIVIECCSSTSSSDYGDLENACAILAAETVRRKVWVHDINMKRKEKGEFHHLVKELEEHPNRYEMYFRMRKDEFNFLHDLINDDIKTRNTEKQSVRRKNWLYA
jgi:hypothetical protein